VDLPGEGRRGQVVGDEDRADGSAQLDQGGVGGVLGPRSGEAAEDLLGLGRAQAQGGGVLDHLVVLLGDDLPADGPGQRGPDPLRRFPVTVGTVEALGTDLLEPG
jgi:hypothetical protein